jgi:Arc/MetJ-type ribon-helix-helix transcriptional regulator
MISFRVTEEEYYRFRDACVTRGISSISELAREAVDMVLEQGMELHQGQRTQQGALEARVSELESRIQILSLELTRLNQRSQSAIGLETL